MSDRHLSRSLGGSALSLCVMAWLVPGPAEPADCNTPLDIRKPVYTATRVVAYEHGTAGCQALIYANGTERVGERQVSPVGYGEVHLTRPLAKGDVLTAKQDPNGSPTWPQKAPTVDDIPYTRLINGEQFPTPLIPGPIVACQLGFRVQGLIEGARAGYGLSGSRSESGAAWTPYTNTFLGVQSELQQNDQLVAWQDMEALFPKRSNFSPPETVQALPKSLPVPDFVEDVGSDGVADVLVGSTVLTFCDLQVGARLVVYAVDRAGTEKPVGGGIATADCNWTHVEPLEKDLKYCARQSLCRLSSLEPKCVFGKGEIAPPRVRKPLCPDDVDVLIDDTTLGSDVWVRVNGADRGNASAPGSTTLVNLDGGVALKGGDKVAARQANQAQRSTWSVEVTVEASKARCEALKKPPSPHFPPVAVGGTSTPAKKDCTGKGNSCQVHPPECGGRGSNWMVDGKIECVQGKPVCKATPGVDYCSKCADTQPGCGPCYGQSCGPGNLCPPGSTCAFDVPQNRYYCKPVGLGCTPISNLCWKKSEVGQEQLGCQQSKP